MPCREITCVKEQKHTLRTKNPHRSEAATSQNERESGKDTGAFKYTKIQTFM